MSRVGFEPTIRASERAKAVHALDCSVTVTGATTVILLKVKRCFSRDTIIKQRKEYTRMYTLVIE
jgi:hypothetical protein